jgi:hypothetical protein
MAKPDMTDRQLGNIIEGFRADGWSNSKIAGALMLGYLHETKGKPETAEAAEKPNKQDRLNRIAGMVRAHMGR